VNVIVKVERDLQPWVDSADVPEFVTMWGVNKRIVCLLTELLRLHSAPEALIVVAKHSSIVEQATEGLSVDGEACTMPQLEVNNMHVPVQQYSAFHLFYLLMLKLCCSC
jgi:GIGANTEA protein